jgi:tRNA nucleotidyltransferase/poly(A) polymerase
MNYRDEKGEAKAIIEDYLRVLRSQFYLDDDRRFFAQRYMLVQALAWPARAMREMGVWLPPERIRQILGEIIQEIKRHGATDQIRHFGAYFLHTVQAHVKHHRTAYYEEGKTARAVSVDSMPLERLLEGVKCSDQAETPAQTTDRLVEIADMFRPKRFAGKKPAAAPAAVPPDQLSLGL